MKTELAKTIQEHVLATLAEGRPLTEETLGRQAGVGRASIRRALVPLLEYGLITQRKKAGIFLKTPTLKEIVDIYDARIAMEGMAARLLAERITPDLARRLKHFCQGMHAPPKSIHRHRHQIVKNDYLFHSFIIDHCGNTCLKKIMTNFLILTLSFRYPLPPKFDLECYARIHEELMAIIASGNGARAEEAMRRHILTGKQKAIESLTGIKLGENS
jgi:DNA-binding GntR family transcriptional regulator